VIDRGTWEVPPIFRVLAELGTVPEVDQWDTWNMGIGLVVMVPAADAAAALRVVPGAKIIGRVETATGPRRIRWGSL
jgi:phosphoribosylformylglycinamidine cyclo-ligase